MWDEQDGFFYDLLRLPDGRAGRLKVRSMVGLLPLCASTVFDGDAAERFPKLMEMIALFRKRHPELISHVAPTDDGFVGHNQRRLLSILNKKKLERVLGYLLDENGIPRAAWYSLSLPLSPRASVHGSASVSRSIDVQYLPAESDTGMFGGNSNWRGPVWMPVNTLISSGAVEPLRLLR